MAISRFMLFKDGQYVKYIDGYAKNMSLNLLELGLDNTEPFRISLDQSSSSTGIYATNKSRTFHLIGTIERDTTPLDMYKNTLFLFIRRMLDKCFVDLFVTESVLFQREKNRALPVLAQLKGFINGWRSQIPELQAMDEERFAEIAPAAWKKHVYNKEKGKGRFNKKAEIASDIVDIYPELKTYFDIVPKSSDYDAFDAVGILYGYEKEHRVDENLKRIVGTKDYHGDVYVFYKFLTPAEAGSRDIMIMDFELYEDKFGLNFAEPDAQDSWYGNIRMAVSAKRFTMSVVEDPMHKIALQWQFSTDLRSRVVLAFILRASEVTKSERTYLCGKYLHEFVTW